MTLRSVKALSALLAGGLLAAGCSQSEPDPEASAAMFAEAIQGGNAIASRAVDPASLPELLPNTRYQGPNGAQGTLTDLVVVGSVTNVTAGRGFYMQADKPPIEIPFDDPRVMWRTVHAEVAVTEVLGGELDGTTVLVGFALGPNTPLDVPVSGLPGMGEIVLFLEQSQVFPYDKSIWGVYEDGAMIAEVEAGGRLVLPAIERGRSERLVSQTTTLGSLRAAARQPSRVQPAEVLQDGPG